MKQVEDDDDLKTKKKTFICVSRGAENIIFACSEENLFGLLLEEFRSAVNEHLRTSFETILRRLVIRSEALEWSFGGDFYYLLLLLSRERTIRKYFRYLWILLEEIFHCCDCPEGPRVKGLFGILHRVYSEKTFCLGYLESLVDVVRLVNIFFVEIFYLGKCSLLL